MEIQKRYKTTVNLVHYQSTWQFFQVDVYNDDNGKAIV